MRMLYEIMVVGSTVQDNIYITDMARLNILQKKHRPDRDNYSCNNKTTGHIYMIQYTEFLTNSYQVKYNLVGQVL